MNYWIAMLRSFDRAEQLRTEGFRTPGRVAAEYAYLEACEANRSLLSRAGELGVTFLTDGKKHLTVTEGELDSMDQAVLSELAAVRVRVIAGVYANMEGTVEGLEGDLAVVKIQGLTRTYTARVTKTDLIPADEADVNENVDIDPEL